MAAEHTKSQYAAASRVPLIQSPSLRVPRPVEMPPDIHPLPDSVTPYFVYPFTLETHILTLESSRRQTIAAHSARREAYLRAREEEKERRKREALRRIAPGFEPTGTPLVPVRKDTPSSLASLLPVQGQGHDRERANGEAGSGQRDVMDDLVDQLAALESKHSS